MTRRSELIAALEGNEAAFSMGLDDPRRDRLADYFEIVMEHNDLLHLVAPCTPETFATRHVLESLSLVRHLPDGAEFIDVGSGAGLPSIPCLVASSKLSAVLVESKPKKAAFLTGVIEQLGLSDRAIVIARQFEEAAPPPSAKFVTSRALDGFERKLPKLLKWANNRKLLLFGGTALGDRLRSLGREFSEELLPLSERRFLFIVPALSSAGKE